MMHTYRSSSGVHTVGHYVLDVGPHQQPRFRFVAMRDFKTEHQAAGYASWLNGGERPAWLENEGAQS